MDLGCNIKFVLAIFVMIKGGSKEMQHCILSRKRFLSFQTVVLSNVISVYDGTISLINLCIYHTVTEYLDRNISYK